MSENHCLKCLKVIKKFHNLCAALAQCGEFKLIEKIGHVIESVCSLLWKCFVLKIVHHFLVVELVKTLAFEISTTHTSCCAFGTHSFIGAAAY